MRLALFLLLATANAFPQEPLSCPISRDLTSPPRPTFERISLPRVPDAADEWAAVISLPHSASPVSLRLTRSPQGLFTLSAGQPLALSTVRLGVKEAIAEYPSLDPRFEKLRVRLRLLPGEIAPGAKQAFLHIARGAFASAECQTPAGPVGISWEPAAALGKGPLALASSGEWQLFSQPWTMVFPVGKGFLELLTADWQTRHISARWRNTAPSGYFSLGVGQALPASTLTLLDGSTMPLLGGSAEYVLLDIWASWCEPCLAAAPTLANWQKSGRVTILSINADLSRAALDGFLAKHSMPGYPVAATSPSTLLAAARNRAEFPAYILASRDGKILSVTNSTAELANWLVPPRP